MQQTLQVAAFDHGFDIFPGMGMFVHGGFSYFVPSHPIPLPRWGRGSLTEIFNPLSPDGGEGKGEGELFTGS